MTKMIFFKDKDDNWKAFDELKVIAEKKDAEEEKYEKDFRQVGKILERFSKR